jgi:hypothetical protein
MVAHVLDCKNRVAIPIVPRGPCHVILSGGFATWILAIDARMLGALFVVRNEVRLSENGIAANWMWIPLLIWA